MQPLSPFTGTTRFELLRQIGEGGFGVVYESLDRQRAARVALKLLRQADGSTLLRFKREFRALSDVSHPNLVSLYELLTDGVHWFFTMELVDGEPLTRYVRRGREPDEPNAGTCQEVRVRQVLPQLVDAICTLHRLGIVHRDVKPSNVLVTNSGRVVLLDFGLLSERDPSNEDEDYSTYPSSGLNVLGTPAYMAPEQGTAAGATPAADWYSVGVMLYESLAGRLPFDGKGIAQLEAKLAGPPPPAHEINPEVPQDLSEICAGLLALDPGDRAQAVERLQAIGRMDDRAEPFAATSVTDAFVGRTAHLTALQNAYEVAMQGTTLVAMVSGVSGIGKTALARQFLAERRRAEPDLVALVSRCYERESAPYKAVDPLVDAIARYLRRLRDIEVARLLPRDAALLGRLFPALRAVDEIRRVPEYGTSGLDSIAVRQRAALALRDLLFELAVRVPLVLWIDDAQWGDADSAAILEVVLRSADSPPMLLVASFRAEDARDAPLVAALARLGRLAHGPVIRSIAVGPLSEVEAQELAAQLASTDSATTATLALESGGSPFFVHELARHVVSSGRSVRLADVVNERVRSLPVAAQRLMASVALSAEPLPPSVAAAASGVGDDSLEALHILRSARMVRVAGQGEERTIEPYHDRIRESVVSQQSAEDTAACHLALAAAWERSALARPETLTTHFLRAGETAKAVHYGAQAAERAVAALAFDRAADLYAMLVRLDEIPVRRRGWQVSLGDALVNCGRGLEAATAYLDALKCPGGSDVVELERRAAAELIRAGYLEEATEVLERLLPKVGVRPLGGTFRAVVTLLTYRVLLGLRGLRVRLKPESDVPRAALQRVDVLVSISPPLTLISLPRGLAVNLQAVWHALNAGEPKRASVGIALFASTITLSGTRTCAKALRAVAQAKALAEPLNDPWTSARAVLAEGICYKVSGYWKKGIDALERAINAFTRCPGARWEIETAQTLRHDALIWTGEWRKLASELPARRHDAQQRGDLYSEAQVAGRLSPLIRLAENRLDDARAEARDARRFYARPHFNLQHRAALCALLDIDLYDGDAHLADSRLQGEWSVLTGTLALFQNGRIEAHYYRARIAVMLAAGGDRRAWATAASAANRLERESAGYATALAGLTRAAIAYGRDDVTTTATLLKRGIAGFAACDMQLYAAAARFWLGRVTEGDEGDQLVESSVAAMTSEGIAAPERIAALLAPGTWTPA